MASGGGGGKGIDATWVLTAALKNVYEDAAEGAEAAAKGRGSTLAEDFIAAAKWKGQKAGFYFGTRDLGTGYYRDPKQPQPSSGKGAAAAAAAAASKSGASGEASANGQGAAAAAAAPAPAAHRDGEELLREAEEQMNGDEIQVLDARGVKRLVVAFERKYKENLEARMKYADQPDKFLDSEVDLDEHVKSLMQVAGYPDMYPIVLEQPGCIPALLALLSHDNTDIAADAVELLAELTGSDAVAGYEAEGQALVEALLEHNAPELLVQRLSTLNEEVDDEAAAVNNLMQVFENLVEVKPEVAEQLVLRTNLLAWLLTRVRRRAFDSNKQYASEVLAILIQGNPVLQRKLLEADGIDVLLQAVAPYKSRDPTNSDEEEFMQNCFDVLCACIMLPECRTAFLKGEGVELMYLMLSGKRRLSRFGAIRLLDFATSSCPSACEKLVDVGGLRSLFGLFMGKAKAKGPKGERDVEAEVEERAVSIIGNLMSCLPRGSRRDRAAAKFVEAEFEKTDRLFEVYFRYATKVADEERRIAEQLLAEQDAAAAARGGAEDEEAEEDQQQPVGAISEEELLVARLGAGLFTLQQASLILGHLWLTADPGLRRRILQLLHQHGQSLAQLRDLLLEYYNNIGTDSGADEQERQRAKLRTVLEALGATAPFDGQDVPAPPPPPPPQTTAGRSGGAAAPPLPPDRAADDEDGGAAPLPPPLPPSAAAERSNGGTGPRGDRSAREAAPAADGEEGGREAGRRQRDRDGEDVQQQQRPAAAEDRRDGATKRSGREYVDDAYDAREESPPPPSKHGDKEHRKHKDRSKDKDRDRKKKDDTKDHERDKERSGRDKGEKVDRRDKDREKDSRRSEGKRERDRDEFVERDERDDRKSRKRDKRSLSR